MGIAAFLFFLLSFVFFLSCFRYLFIPLFIFLYDKGLIFYAYRNGLFSMKRETRRYYS